MIKLSTSSFTSDGWRDRVGSVLRGVRRAFTRDNLIRNLKTLVGVAPLTILVWVYAEEQELVTETGRVRIELQSADPAHRAVNLLSPADGTIQVTLQGSQVGIDRMQSLLQQTLLSKPLEIVVGTSLPPGAHQPLASLDQIAANPLFFRNGVTVTACSPETLMLRVDGLEDRLATVVPPPDAPGLIKAVFTPANVIMRGPANSFPRDRLTAMPDLSDEPVMKIPGQHNGITVHLSPLDNFTFVPSVVTADLTVGQADQTISVSPVPVKVLAPKYLTDNYKFDYKEVLPQPVTLIGSPQALLQVDPHNPKLVAVVELDVTDGSFHGSKPVTFEDRGLPDGVRVKPDNVSPVISINVDPR